jgi:trimeric autotransporter adhesin
MSTQVPSHGMLGLVAAAAALLLAIDSAPSSAQEPTVFFACYVPSTGTVYRIKEPGLPEKCAGPASGGKQAHVEFSWTDGMNAVRVGSAAAGDLSGLYPDPVVAALQGVAVANAAPEPGQVLTYDDATSAWMPAMPATGVTEHGDLTGLTDDDHPQYLLGDGVRNVTNGFAVAGTLHFGAIPVQGAGTRLMWYPRRGALRAGTVTGTQWDDANIGQESTALGVGTTASGHGSTAMGEGATASGSWSTAMGQRTTASGGASTAMGGSTTASGIASTAMGSFTTASGNSSTAMGGVTEASGHNSTAMGFGASTAGHQGSFVYSDVSGLPVVTATAPNQFVVRASGGFRFRTSSDLSTGCDLPASSGNFNCTSSRLLKTGFAAVEGEDLLARVRALPITSWRYSAEPGDVRHLGPFAEDFYQAFGLGKDDKSIGLLDIAGVSLAGVKALEKRTRETQEKTSVLERENAELRARIARLEAALAQLEQR